MAVDLATLTRRYVEARDEVARLTRERDGCACDFETLYEFGETIREPLRTRAATFEGVRAIKNGNPDPAREPCWRCVVVDAGDDGAEVEAIGDYADEGWCEPCRRRQALHVEMKAAKKRVAARLSALVAHARVALDIPAPPKPQPPAPAPRVETAPSAPVARPWDNDEIPF